MKVTTNIKKVIFDMNIIRKIFRAFKALWYYFWSHIFIVLYYDIKYTKGKHFITGKYFNINARGWRWLYYAARDRRYSGGAKWPVTPKSKIICPENISFDPDDINIFQSAGCYFQALGKIIIGKGTYISNNVGIITSNHTVGNLNMHDEPKEVNIGEGCWIGMNCMILPGVSLGDNTVVGAGAVVTKSFLEGNCVVAGNPAKLIKRIEL